MKLAKLRLPILIVAHVLFLASCASGSKINGKDASVKPAPFPQITPANAARLVKVASLDLPTSNFTSIEILPDTFELMAGDRSGEVVVWSKDSGEYTKFLPPIKGFGLDENGKALDFGTLAVSPDGMTVVTSAAGHCLEGRDRAGKLLFSLPVGDRIYQTAISPDSRFLAIGCYGKRVAVFNLASRELLAELGSDYEFMSGLAFSPDSSLLLASFERPGNLMKTWDTSTWKITASFVHVSERFDYHDIQFSPDGRSIILTGTRLDVEVLDAASKEPVRSLQGHASAPYDMAFSPDGSLLASAADDGSVKLWDMGSGALAGDFWVAREAGVVRFSPDGTWLVVGVWGKGLEVWAVGR